MSEFIDLGNWFCFYILNRRFNIKIMYKKTSFSVLYLRFYCTWRIITCFLPFSLLDSAVCFSFSLSCLYIVSLHALDPSFFVDEIPD